MNQVTTLSAALATACILMACSDPADKVHKASASEPGKEVPTAAPSQNARNYVIRTNESTISFVGSKVTGSHDGGFKNFSGMIPVAEGKIVGTPEIQIDMTSTWSDNERLTGHLKSADFFDVQKFPTSTFTVTSIEPVDGQHKVSGNLNLHGETKSVSFPAKIEVSDAAVTVNAEFAINRKDFNITYPGKPDDLIRDNVVLKLAIKATPLVP